MIFALVGHVMCWCGNMMIMESSGTFANNAIGGISTTINCHNGRLAAKSAKMTPNIFYRLVLTMPILRVYLGKQWTGVATMISKEAI